MKRIITSALVIMLTIGAAQAQKTTDKREGHKKEHKMAFDNLNLSADQKARLQSIREDFKKQSADLKNNTQLSAEEKKTRRKALHEQFRTQSAAVLTPAQKDQMAKMKAEWKEKNKDTKKEWKRKKNTYNNHSIHYYIQKLFYNIIASLAPTSLLDTGVERRSI